MPSAIKELKMDKFDLELSDNKSKMMLLSPEIVEIRDKIVDKLEGESLKGIRAKIREFLANEKNEETRLAALAARIVLLRRFISELSENQALLAEEEMSDLENKSLDYDDDFEEDYDSDDFDVDNQWKRLRIIEDCEVNGVRFPAGIQIDVKLIDAERLLEAGQAEIIEKPVDPEEDAEETEESEETETDESDESEESEEVEETENDESEESEETETDESDESEESEEVEETENDESEESEETETDESDESEESEEVEETEDNEGEDYDETTEDDDDPSGSDEDTDVSEDDEDS
jgi:hypothetical protein